MVAFARATTGGTEPGEATPEPEAVDRARADSLRAAQATMAGGAPTLEDEAGRSSIAVPLHLRGQTVGAIVLGVLLAGFAFVVQSSQRDARQSLTDRYEARATLTASFTRSFVDDLAARLRVPVIA